MNQGKPYNTNLLVYAALVKSVDTVPRFSTLFQIILAKWPEHSTPKQHINKQLLHLPKLNESQWICSNFSKVNSG